MKNESVCQKSRWSGMEVTNAERFKRMKNTSTILPTRWHHNLAEAHKIVSFLICDTNLHKTLTKSTAWNMTVENTTYAKSKIWLPLHYQYWYPYSYPINNFN